MPEHLAALSEAEQSLQATVQRFLADQATPQELSAERRRYRAAKEAALERCRQTGPERADSSSRGGLKVIRRD